VQVVRGYDANVDGRLKSEEEAKERIGRNNSL
jgi:hypothetical protein